MNRVATTGQALCTTQQNISLENRKYAKSSEAWCGGMCQQFRVYPSEETVAVLIELLEDATFMWSDQ